MQEITTLCTGCRTCEQICPKHAISMVYNDEGFLIPDIDEHLCIECGLCKRKCPQELLNLKTYPQKIVAAKIKDDIHLKDSTSGGLFWLIAHGAILNGAVVYGCAYQDDFIPTHIRVTSSTDLIKLQGSKYVQSDTKDTYSLVKNDLENGKFVVYSGTPCQIAGLKSFLTKEYNNLLLVDILCHGVPSPLLFKRYKKWLEKKYRGSLKTYSFRYKKNGFGGRYLLRYILGEKEYTNPIMLDPYGDAFLSGRTFRECCYQCKYASLDRTGDFSLGDFWNPNALGCEFDTSKGVSMVLINSEKAYRFWKSIISEIDYKEATVDQANAANEAIRKSVNRKAERDLILKDYEQDGFFDKQLAVGLKLKLRIMNIIPISVKEKIKRIIRRG